MDVKAARSASNALRKRPFVGSGIQSVLRQVRDGDSGTPPTARQILVHLLQDKGVEVGDDTEGYNAGIDDQYGASLTVSKKDAIPPGTDDSAIAALGRDGKLSLFRSLLSVIDRSEGAQVTTKHLIKTSCLAVRPGDVPGLLDAREVVMSALYFLSSNLRVKSPHLVSLPLIRPTQELPDLEKRSFEKVGAWDIGSIGYKLLHLEQAFFHSPASFEWLSREKFSPRLTAKEEARFFLKGTIPAALSYKKMKAEGAVMKRRASTSSDKSTVQSPPAKKANTGVLSGSESVAGDAAVETATDSVTRDTTAGIR